MRITTSHDDLPLTPQTFHILLALAERPLHGYGLMQQIAQDSDGLVAPGPGSMYSALKRLAAARWLEPQSRLGAYGKLTQQQRYELTSVGRVILGAEVDRLRAITALATTRLT